MPPGVLPGSGLDGPNAGMRRSERQGDLGGPIPTRRADSVVGG